MSPRTARAATTTLTTALAASVLLASAAAAHTHLASTTPSDGSRLRLAPSAVVLRFTQPVDARTAILRVVDQRGAEVPVASASGERGVVRLRLRRPLPRGDYAVGYRVLADDGHAMSGGLAFTVAPRAGVAAAPGAGRDGRSGARGRTSTAALVREAVPRDAAWTGPAMVAARAGQYAGLVLGLGGVVFLLLAWWPAAAAAAPGCRDPATATWRRTLAVGIAIGAASAALGLVAHAFDAAGAGPTPDRVAGGATDRAAVLWLEATACWVVAAVLLRRSAALTPRAATRLLAPLSGALLATALSGHGGSDGDLLATAAAVVHGVAAATWIGAIAWLALAARSPEGGGGRAAIMPGLATRVSRLSLAAALATLVSGAVQAIAVAGGPLTLPGSSYGRLVLVKVALFAGLVALGALHRRRALPALHARGSAGAGGRSLRATLRAELALAALVLAAAGILTGSAPPEAGTSPPSPSSVASAR